MAGGDPVTRWRQRLRTLTAGGRRAAVLDEGNGPPVVLLHGIPTHSYLWRSVVPVLALEYRAIAPDLLGFGFSDKSASADLSPAGQATFIEAILDELDVESYTLVVHDYGALVACELLARNPNRIRHLTITNTSLRLSDWRGGSPVSPLRLLAFRPLGEIAFALARPFMLKWAFSIYVSERDRLDSNTMALYWAPFDEGFRQTLLTLFRCPSPTEADFARWRDALSSYTGPALIAWGALDPTFRPDRAEDLTRLIPNSRYQPFQHANHFIQEDRPTALGRLIAATLP